MRRTLGIVLIVVGALLLLGLAAFLYLALGYRHSFTSSDVPIADMLQAVAVLSPVVIVAATLLFFGVRMSKRAP